MTATINTAHMKRDLLRRVRAVPVAMAHEMKAVIIDNSKASKSITGSKLRKYSPAYAKWRAKHGLSTVPDLRVTGSMLDKAYVGATDTKATLMPNSADRMKAAGNQRHRKFYPEQDSDLKGPTLKRLKKAGEAAFAT